VVCAGDEVVTFGITAGEVEEVDTCEDDEEAGEERERVDYIGGVEAAVEDERGAESCGCEGNVVEGVYTVNC